VTIGSALVPVQAAPAGQRAIVTQARHHRERHGAFQPARVHPGVDPDPRPALLHVAGLLRWYGAPIRDFIEACLTLVTMASRR
jgi:hypothetical protein